MPRILFVAAHRPDRSPSQRYRFEQFTDHWQRHGFTHEYAWLIGPDDDRIFYSPGRFLAKAQFFVRSWFRRRAQVARARDFDLIMVQREAFMTGSTRFERQLALSGVPLIYDFDDAVWHLDVSDANRNLRWLKDPAKTGRIIALADRVIAGNGYLAEYAKRYNPRVEVIPTVIDTEQYTPNGDPVATHGPVVIGWTGSYTSLAHLKQQEPMLHALYRQWGDRIRFRVISDRDLTVEGLPIENIRWSSAREAQDLASIDIGIMPLPNDEWSRGKCGFKGLQYMGMGKAVVLSAVGVNKEIVQHGVNGMLANTQAEWLQALGQLIADADLRTRMGQEARRTVEEHYSVRAWRDRYLAIFGNLIAEHKKRTDND